MIRDQETVHLREVRRILYSVLTNASKFDAFCGDYFPAIYSQFSNGMDREAKITLLLSSVSAEQILRELRRAHPSGGGPAEDGPEGSSRHSALAIRQKLLSQRLAHLLTERDTLRKYQADMGQLDGEIAAAQRDLRHGPQLNPGEILADRYQLIAVVGQGSFGQVWEAENLYPDDAIPAKVAVKVLRGSLSSDRTFLSRFICGSQQMKRLQHPHIACVYLEASQYQGFHFFVMEFFPAGDLRAAVLRDKDGHKRDEWLRVALQAGDALVYSHRAGCIHRDVKPQNVLGL